MYRLVLGRTLGLFDSGFQRMELRALNSLVAPGHYRVPMLERFAPRSRHYGPGRIFIDALKQRDVDALIQGEKASESFENLRFDREPALPIGKPPDNCVMHGGGETLSATLSVAKYQPLTRSHLGIRLHNAEAEKLMDFLELRLRIQQLVVLTVLPPKSVI